MNRSFPGERRRAAKYADNACDKNPSLIWDEIFNKELSRLICLAEQVFKNQRAGKARKIGQHKYAGEVGFVKPRNCSGFLHGDFHP